MFGPTVSPQLVQSGKGRIASDPALLNLPRPLMVGAFSVYGSDKQIFGMNEQILVRADPQRPKNNSRVLHEWSGTFIRTDEKAKN